MAFGPFDEDSVFHIEKSRLYCHVNLGRGQVPTAELLLLKKPAPALSKSPSLWLVEAKSSSPRPENNMRFKDFIGEVKAKLNSSLCLFAAALLGRHTEYCDLPDGFLKQDFSALEIKLILVLRGHKKEWLEPVSDALQKSLWSAARIWGFPSGNVVVINDEMAKRLRLIED